MLHAVLLRLLIVSLVLPAPAVSGLFEWLRSPERRPPPAADAPPPPAADAPPPPASAAPTLLAKEARFEMVVADDKFLAEAKHLEISQLDSCHYLVCLDIHLHLI